MLSQSFSDMVHAGPATAMCDWGETGDERCHGLRFPRWLDAAQRSPATHSFASGCMWSMEWSHAPGSHCFPADIYEDMSFREYRQTYRPILRNGRPYFVAIYNATKSPPLRTPLLLTPLSPCKFLPSPPSAVRGGEYSEERSAARAEGHLPDRVGLSLKVKSEEIDLPVKKKLLKVLSSWLSAKLFSKRKACIDKKTGGVRTFGKGK